jgi:ABC-type phosphate transport system permease subunit
MDRPRDPAIAARIRLKVFLITFGVIAVTIALGIAAGIYISRTADEKTIHAIID